VHQQKLPDTTFERLQELNLRWYNRLDTLIDRMTQPMYRMSYYPWIVQHVELGEIDRQIKIFGSLIKQELERLGAPDPRVEVLPSLEVPEQIKQIATGGAEIALMNPLGFVFARQGTGGARSPLEAVAVALRIIDGKVGKVYFSQLYTAKKTAIRTREQVANRSIGYGLPYSTSNFLVAAARLLEVGVHPLTGVTRVEFLKGHDVVAKAVYEGRVDVGAGHDGVIVDLANQPGYGDAADVLVQIARSPPIPSDPIVTNIPNDAERQRVQRAIVAAGNSDAGKSALKIFWGNAQGLEVTDTASYANLSEALKDLRLGAADLLPKT
jgi:phosphonate transport system substrate-binding protein